ncbi:MAG TPA: hypothetical protein VL996_11575, partial [Methylocella sp.]|nr:hypothetical protein [Methylocella sp.]
KPGTVSFGWGAAYELDWNSAPVITLDMEFRHDPVWLVFKLILRALRTDVKIEHFSCGNLGDPRQDLAALFEALADARLNASDH